MQVKRLVKEYALRAHPGRKSHMLGKFAGGNPALKPKKGQPAGAWELRHADTLAHGNTMALEDITAGAHRPPTYSDVKVANRNDRGFGWEIAHEARFATPAGFPRHECSPYRGLHVRREKRGVCPWFKDHSLSRRAKP